MTGKARARTKTIGIERDKRDSKYRLSAVAAIAETLSDFGNESLGIAAILSLACRGLLPERHESDDTGELIKHLARKLFTQTNIIIDRSALSRHATGWVEPATAHREKTLSAGFLERLQAFCIDDFASQQIRDPLFTGWIYQCLLMKRNNYAALRGAKSLGGLSQITQWFTPSWIAEFIVDECLPIEIPPNMPFNFMDSSCGAGHIIVPAIRRLLSRRLETKKKDVAIEQVLNHELFGLDIDPLMVRLSAFSTYLTCRDYSIDAPLPIPQLFSFSNVIETASNLPDPACHGSLLLSLKQRPDVSLYRIDGSRILATELPIRFSSQALNPPYLSHRLMPKESARFLLQNYSGSHYDLYASFMELGVRLMADHGRLAMICQQSFLTTARYEELRRRLVDRCRINSIVHLGPGSFDSRAGEKVNNAIISLSNLRADTIYDKRSIRTYNIVSGASKSIAERDGIKTLQNIEMDEKEFLTRSRMIPGFPLAGLCPAEVAQLFEQLPTISKADYGITLTNGLFTCDNKRFVRHFTEIDSSTATKETTFVPYDKGGGQKWFSTTPYLLEWKNDGNEIREFRAGRGQSRALPGERFYFRNGITYSYIGTKGFKARLLSPGSVFDIASSALFSDQIDLHYMLGFLNSALVRFILGTLNPTVNFQIGDLRRIPMRKPAADVEQQIAALATEAVNLARQADRLNPASPAFVSIPDGELNMNERAGVGVSASTPNRESPDGYGLLVERISRINQSEALIQEKIDEAVFNLYEISDTTRNIILQNEWVVRTKDPLIPVPSLQKFLSLSGL